MRSQLGTGIACGACCVTYCILFFRHELDCEPRVVFRLRSTSRSVSGVYTCVAPGMLKHAALRYWELLESMSVVQSSIGVRAPVVH